MHTAPRPSALLSAAAAALSGADPMLVSDIPSWHPDLAPAVRDLAASTGDRVPLLYALLLPVGPIPDPEPRATWHGESPDCLYDYD